jgi:HNH endonuclease
MIDQVPHEIFRKSYSSKNWKALREEVFRIDGYTCQRCFREKASGVVLQVHHKRYRANKKPWEYPYSELETLCKACHAEEHGHIRPSSGWELVDSDDLGDLLGYCEVCGTNFRYQYTISHPKWHTVEVGTVCCDLMTGTRIATEDQKKRKSLSQRKKSFLDSKAWQKNFKGHLQTRYRKQTLEIFIESGQFTLLINQKKSKVSFSTLPQVKAYAFEKFEANEPKFQAWLKKNLP